MFIRAKIENTTELRGPGRGLQSTAECLVFLLFLKEKLKT